MAKKIRKISARPAQDKVAKFTELAQKRMTKALKAISQLSNLANRSNYEFTEKQVQAMLDALDAQLSAVAESFAQKDKAVQGGFEFK